MVRENIKIYTKRVARGFNDLVNIEDEMVCLNLLISLK